MKIKQKPEDFSVIESYRFDPVPGGRFRVYMMDKQKLSTFDAVERIRTRFGLKPGVISYCGLKDKQGRTEQIIAVDGADVDVQEPDLRLKFLGTTDKPLSARNITSNRFSVTVRGLTPDDLTRLNLSTAEVNRLGVVNYFDSQRFGSLKHGQGFIAKDLLRGDFEAALKNYLAKPSELDRTDDAKVKGFLRDHWGDWGRRIPFPGAKKYERILRSLRDDPTDWVKAFLQIDSSYRAMQLFTYQSYLWNEGVRRLLQLLLPRESLFPVPYQAGTLLFHRDASPEVLDYLREATFPLLAPNSVYKDEKVREAAEWVLGREKITLDKLRIAEAPKLLFFKHEERPILSFPHKLVLGKTMADELNRGGQKLNIAFTLQPGAYATLVVKRLFHFSYRDDTPEEIEASRRVERDDEAPGRMAPRTGPRPSRPQPTAPRTGSYRTPARGRGEEAVKPAEKPVPSVVKKAKAKERTSRPAVAKGNFRAGQKAKKAAKEAARTANPSKSRSKPGASKRR